MADPMTRTASPRYMQKTGKGKNHTCATASALVKRAALWALSYMSDLAAKWGSGAPAPYTEVVFSTKGDFRVVFF
jgi:hypothetical protein